MGAPMKADRPWHMVTRPNALVSLSSPISSTIKIDLSDTNTAEKEEKLFYWNKWRIVKVFLVFPSLEQWFSIGLILSLSLSLSLSLGCCKQGPVMTNSEAASLRPFLGSSSKTLLGHSGFCVLEGTGLAPDRRCWSKTSSKSRKSSPAEQDTKELAIQLGRETIGCLFIPRIVQAGSRSEQNSWKTGLGIVITGKHTYTQSKRSAVRGKHGEVSAERWGDGGSTGDHQGDVVDDQGVRPWAVTHPPA